MRSYVEAATYLKSLYIGVYNINIRAGCIMVKGHCKGAETERGTEAIDGSAIREMSGRRI